MRGVLRHHLATINHESLIAGVASAGIVAHLWLRWGTDASPFAQHVPLYAVLTIGGAPLVLNLALKALRRQFGTDLLAGISIVTAVLLGEYLAGALVVLMLSGGGALEAFAVGRASSVLRGAGPPDAARSRTAASTAASGTWSSTRCASATELVVFPHEICPVDGVVVEGHGVMDESYLTGEPFMMPKAPGSEVFSGAINGESALTLRATRLAVDSRYARIMNVMRDSEQRRPRLRRLGDRARGVVHADRGRSRDGRLVLERRTGSFPGRARRRDAVSAAHCHPGGDHRVHLAGGQAQHRHSRSGRARADRQCRTIVLDKTGHADVRRADSDRSLPRTRHSTMRRVLQLAASLERYSKHPLARPILADS